MANAPIIDEAESKALVDKLCGKFGSEEYEKFCVDLGYPGFEKYPITLSATYDTSSHNQTISLLSHNGGALIRFYIKPVDACCAMSFLYSFIVVPNMPQAVVDAILKAVLTASKLKGLCLSSNRLIVNMVESGRPNSDPLAIVLPIESPQIVYKQFWTSFHNNAARVNTMLMPNGNTGKIIHHMEVLFSQDYFKG